MYSDQQGFSPSLHALRGLAALSVVVFHAKLMPPVLETNRLGIVSQFGAGVTLFFLLSGFSLALSNHGRIERPNWLTGYMIRRLARILPVWYLFVAIHMVYHYFEFGKVYSLSEVLLHLVPVFGLIPGSHESLVWAGWTIGVEMLFYAVFPLFLLMLGTSVWIWAAATAVAVAVAVAFVSAAPAGLPTSYPYMSIVNQLFVFLLGATLFFAAKRLSDARSRRVAAGAVAVVGAVSFLWWGLVAEGVSWAQTGPFTLPLKAVALGSIVFLAHTLWPPRYGIGRIARFLGDHSYTIYLAHPIVVVETRRVYPGIVEAVGEEARDLAFLLYLSYVLFWSCLFAWLITRVVEAPLYRRGTSVARDLESRSATRTLAPGE